MNSKSTDTLPFEAPLQELKNRIAELRANVDDTPGLQDLLGRTESQHAQLEKEFYEQLSPWNTVQLARHPKRPQVRDYVDLCLDEFIELHGDRKYRDDLAIVTGLGQIGKHRVMLVGQHKGRDVEERHVCHAGCPHPEGYWKALRKMQMAERFGLPIICLIDTKGAYPGVGSEERGVAIAIAENLLEMSRLRTPIINIIIGEGGSGGALGIGVGDRIMMLRHAYYSVISPEGCASILWRDGEKKAQAAAVLKLTCRELLERGFIDEIVDEPLGGAHRDPEAMGKTLRESIIRVLDDLTAQPIDDVVAKRYAKFRNMGEWLVESGPVLPEEPEEKSCSEETSDEDVPASDEEAVTEELVDEESDPQHADSEGAASEEPESETLERS